jgi:hypothetical protein
MFGASGTEDGRFLVMTASKDTARSNLFWVADLEDAHNKEVGIGSELKWEKIVDTWGDYYADVGNDGSKFYLYTNRDGASNYKLVTYDLAKPEEGFKDLVAHDSSSPLTSVHIADEDKLILLYSVDVKGAFSLSLLVFSFVAADDSAPFTPPRPCRLSSSTDTDHLTSCRRYLPPQPFRRHSRSPSCRRQARHHRRSRRQAFSPRVLVLDVVLHLARYRLPL